MMALTRRFFVNAEITQSGYDTSSLEQALSLIIVNCKL